jgi:hypothetical protein
MTIPALSGRRLAVTLSYTVALLALGLLLGPRTAGSDPAATTGPGTEPAAKTDPSATADAASRNDFPTSARVEYVNECIAQNGDSLAALYQCSCAIDRIAARFSYDQFVEAATYAKYAALPGEGGGIFRDSAEARDRAKLYRQTEREARTACGLAR